MEVIPSQVSHSSALLKTFSSDLNNRISDIPTKIHLLKTLTNLFEQYIAKVNLFVPVQTTI